MKQLLVEFLKISACCLLSIMAFVYLTHDTVRDPALEERAYNAGIEYFVQTTTFSLNCDNDPEIPVSFDVGNDAWLLGVVTKNTTELVGTKGFTIGSTDDASRYGVQTSAKGGAVSNSAESGGNIINPVRGDFDLVLRFQGNCVEGSILVAVTLLGRRESES